MRINIALIGFMGVGKSAISSALSRMLSMREVDLDQEIEKTEGMTITDIFAQRGEEYFRACETKKILQLEKETNMVLSCGGGTVLRQENVAQLKKMSKIVLLAATPETIWERVKYSESRPLLNGHMDMDFIRDLMEKRKEAYEQAADIVIDTDHKKIAEVCEKLIKYLNTK